jgi:glycosyltransferase involved in cell wall biosynthesis
MRVLIASCSGEPGGMELRLAQEARLLAGAGWHSTYATPRLRGFEGMAAALRADGVDVSAFDPPQLFEDSKWRRTRQLRARFLAAWQMRRFRPDLVHVAFCRTGYGASVLWVARHCKLPAVISVHDAFPPTSVHPWHARLYAQAFSSVRGVYAVSASAMEHFMGLFGRYLKPSVRLRVIPNSVDTARFIPSPVRRACAREQFGLAPDSLVLGSVARLARHKRPEAVIDLFRALRQRFDKLYLVLAGSGPLALALRDKVQALGLAEYVVFTGHIAAVEEILPALDLHVLLSQHEGAGIATIEAMACGVPVVGTDVPGTADILRASGGGVLVPLNDPGQAVETVAALLDDGARRESMALQARAETEASYAVAVMERRVRDFYAGLVP